MITGVVNKRVQSWIKVIGKHNEKQDSDVLTGSFTVAMRSSTGSSPATSTSFRQGSPSTPASSGSRGRAVTTHLSGRS